MTIGADYNPGREGYEAEPNYPVVFGIKLTPAVSGILIALLGLAGAAYLLVNVVQPAWQRNQELNADIAEKRSQLVDQAETRRQIEEARTRLQEARQLQADVLTLFASPESLDTLLLDLNERVQAVNAGIQDPDRRATLTRFQATTPTPQVVTDSFYGQAANNLLQRQTFDVAMQGNFAQTQSIIRNIERLQPLLVIRDLNSDLDQASQTIRIDPQGRLAPTGQPEPRITTSFQMDALLPASQQASAPAAPAEGTPEAAPGTTPEAAPGASPAPEPSPAQ